MVSYCFNKKGGKLNINLGRMVYNNFEKLDIFFDLL